MFLNLARPLDILALYFAVLCVCATVLGTLVQIDNTSPQIQYQGAWQMTATPGGGDVEDTLASSQTKSDTAIFNFTGTWLSFVQCIA